MKWKVIVENMPDEYDPVAHLLADTVVVNGVTVWDDGFAADGSDWGDAESNAIAAQQAKWQAADPDGNSYACVWADSK